MYHLLPNTFCRLGGGLEYFFFHHLMLLNLDGAFPPNASTISRTHIYFVSSNSPIRQKVKSISIMSLFNSEVTLLSLSHRIQDSFSDYMAVQRHEVLDDHNLDISSFRLVPRQKALPFDLCLGLDDDLLRALGRMALFHLFLA